MNLPGIWDGEPSTTQSCMLDHDFHQQVRFRVGAPLAEATGLEGGTVVTLYAVPPEEANPHEAIYTDTGQRSGWRLQLAFSGVLTFFDIFDSPTLLVEKQHRCTVTVDGGGSVCFEARSILETEIPSGVEPTPIGAKTVIRSYNIDPESGTIRAVITL